MLSHCCSVVIENLLFGDRGVNVLFSGLNSGVHVHELTFAHPYGTF